MKIVLDEGAYEPIRAHEADAGLDLLSPYCFILDAHSSIVIDTGVHIELPKSTVGMLKSKSGLNIKHGIIGDGTIDEGYTGSIRVKLYNLSDRPYNIMRGDKIIQLVIMPILRPQIEVVDRLEETERGENGFGSTGR